MNRKYILAILIVLTTSVFLASCVGADTEFSWYEESEAYSSEASSNLSAESETVSEESDDEFVSEVSLEEKVSLPFVPFD